MGIYEKYFLHRIVNFACRQKPTMLQREKVVPEASGRVVEIGIGSGLNLPFYDSSKVRHIWGVDPSLRMWDLAQNNAADRSFEVRFVQASAEEVPLEDGAADTVVVTYTLCTVPDAVAAVREMRRVLKPGGELIFCEHGLAPDAGVRKWQNRLNPVWRRIGGGCNMNRDIPALLRQGGFPNQRVETMYLPGWAPASFNYWGSAS